MIIGLSVKNKLGFIDGNLPRPNEDLLPSWIRNNNIIISWILNSVSKPISASILFANLARSIWLDLKERFQRKNAPRIFHLKRSLATLSQNQESVSMYFTKFKTLIDELNSYRSACTCGSCRCGRNQEVANFLQTEYLMDFLMGLNDSYAQTRTQLLLMEPIPSISRAFSLLLQEEQQRAIGSFSPAINTPAIALVVSSNNPRNNFVHKHHKDRPICTHCNILGHTVGRCYKVHGYPPRYKTKQQRTSNSNSESVSSNNTNSVTTQTSNASTSLNSVTNLTEALLQCQNLLNQLQSQLTAPSNNSINHIISTLSNSHWIIDSGASTHICHSKEFLTDIKPCSASISLPNKNTYQVKNIGTVKLSDTLIWKYILYMPDFTFNLLSVSAIRKESSLSVQLFTEICTIQDKYTSKKISSAKLFQGLYIIDQPTCFPSICAVTANKASLWNQRMGHPSIETINSLQIPLFLKPSTVDKMSHCTICPLAKQRKLSFTSNNHLSSNAFDLIHVDILRPFSTETYSGYSYFLTIVDDATRYT
ncbi:hypothetical protein IC582_028760 [Cucumis melo]